jgi:hypothetical protein
MIGILGRHSACAMLDEVAGSVGASAIGRFGIDVSRLHWDVISIYLFGDYPPSTSITPAEVRPPQGPPPRPRVGVQLSGAEFRRERFRARICVADAPGRAEAV